MINYKQKTVHSEMQKEKLVFQTHLNTKSQYIYDATSENRLVNEFEVNGKKKYLIRHDNDKFGRGPYFHGADDLKGSPLEKGRYNQYHGHHPEDFEGYKE